MPFSCCTPSVLRPCVHGAMRDRRQHAAYMVGDSTLYRAGCPAAVRLHAARVGSWLVSGLGMLLALSAALAVGCRYLQTSVAEARHAGGDEAAVPSRGYLFSVGRRSAPGIRAPPPTPATASPRRDANRSNRQTNNSTAAPSAFSDETDSQWTVDASDLALIAEQFAAASSTVDAPTTDDAVSPPAAAPLTASPAPAPRKTPSVRSSTSISSNSGSASASPSASLRDDNFNSNAAITAVDFRRVSRPSIRGEDVNATAATTACDSLRSFRPTRSVVPSTAVPDDDTQRLVISTRSRSSAIRQTRSHVERSRSRRRSTSRSGPRAITGSRRKRSSQTYKRADRTTQARKRRSSSSESASSDRSISSEHSPLLRVRPSRRVKTHTAKGHGHTETEQSRHTSGSGAVASWLQQIAGNKVEQRSAPASKPKRSRVSVRKELGAGMHPGTEPGRRVTDQLMPVAPEPPSVEGGTSSGWSTVSCHTVGVGSSTRSKRRRTSTKPRVPGCSSSAAAAALLALSKYFATYNGRMETAAEGHEATRQRSRKSSNNTSNNNTNANASDRKIYLPAKELSAARKQGRSSASSWSTVSYRTVSRPPSSAEFDGELIVDEQLASNSTRQTESKHLLQKNSSCSVDQYTSPFYPTR